MITIIKLIKTFEDDTAEGIDKKVNAWLIEMQNHQYMDDYRKGKIKPWVDRVIRFGDDSVIYQQDSVDDAIEYLEQVKSLYDEMPQLKCSGYFDEISPFNNKFNIIKIRRRYIDGKFICEITYTIDGCSINTDMI